MKTLRSAFIRAAVTSVAKKCDRLSIVLRSRQSQIDFCRRKLMLRSRQSKSFLSRQTQKIFGRRTILLKKLSITSVAKKLRSPDYFALVAPDTKIFGRARRKNFRRRSFLLRSRQSLKRFRQRSHVLPLNQSQQIIGWRTLVLRLAPVAKTFGRARHKQTSGGGHLSFARANSEKKNWSADTFVSVAHVAKFFARASRENTAVRVHLCCSHLSC